MDLEGAVEGPQTIGHPPEPGPVARAIRIEADAIVDDLEGHVAVAVADRDPRLGRVRVFRHVLQGLQATEVDGCLSLL
jgi:hypothetical protein